MKNPEYNCWIETNRKPFLLWLTEKKEAFVDSLNDPKRIRTDIADLAVVKASIFEIVAIKYLFIVFLVYIFFNINNYFVSMSGLALAVIFYSLWRLIYFQFGKWWMYVSMVPLPVSYLFVSFLYFDVASEYTFGFMMNYFIQYMISIYLLHLVYRDLVCEGWRGYYRVEKRVFRYFKILDEKKTEASVSWTKYMTLIFWIGMGVVFFFSFLVATHGIKNKIFTKQLLEERILQSVEKTKVEKVDFDFLDKRAREVGIVPLHREIPGIQDYEEISINKGTTFEVTDIDGNKTQGSYTGEKNIEVKAYIKDNYWFFKSKGKTYRITNGRAR